MALKRIQKELQDCNMFLKDRLIGEGERWRKKRKKRRRIPQDGKLRAQKEEDRDNMGRRKESARCVQSLAMKARGVEMLGQKGNEIRKGNLAIGCRIVLQVARGWRALLS